MRTPVLTISSATLLAILYPAQTEAAVVANLPPNSRFQQDEILSAQSGVLEISEARTRRAMTHDNESWATPHGQSDMSVAEGCVPNSWLNDSNRRSAGTEGLSAVFTHPQVRAVLACPSNSITITMQEESARGVRPIESDATTTHQGPFQSRLITTNASVIRPPASEPILPDPRSPCSQAIGFWVDDEPLILVPGTRDETELDFVPEPVSLLLILYLATWIATLRPMHAIRAARRRPLDYRFA